MAKSTAEIAIDLRAKFEYYLLALTFAILGLSIQTAQFGAYLFADVLELVGWAALFASGIIGILRGEWVPVAYELQNRISSVRDRRNNVTRVMAGGAEVQIPFLEDGRETALSGKDATRKLDTLVSTLEQQFKVTEDRIIRRYKWMRRAFMAGVACLIVARGAPPAISIAERIAALLT